MPELVLCDQCGQHTFVVIGGTWEVWGEDKLRKPITMLCTTCGKELITTTWTGDEDNELAES